MQDPLQTNLGEERKVLPFGPRAQRFCQRHPKDDARINVVVGAVRASKTWSTFFKIIALSRYRVGGHKVITGVSKQAIYHNVLSDLFDIVGESNYSYNRQNGELNIFGCKWIVIGARDEGSEKAIRGMTIGVCVSDELVLMPRSFFMMLLSRMSPQGARLYATTNPGDPNHWVKTEVLESKDYVLGLGKDLWWQTWTMDDNPNLGEEYKGFVKRSYTGVFFQRFIQGLWVVAEGAIYRDVLGLTEYDDTSRPPALLSQNGHIQHIISVDYGTSNPQVYGNFYDDGRTVWQENEYYYDAKKRNRQKTDSEYANDLINGFEEWPGLPKDQRLWPSVIVDPSAASFRTELTARGVQVIEGDNEVLDGIRRTSTMLSQGKIRIHKRCVNTMKDLNMYAWNDKRVEGGAEEPMHGNSHAPDMIRYFVKTAISDWRLSSA